MTWWERLFADRGLRPQTTSPASTVSVATDVAAWLQAAFETASWDELAEREAVERLRSRGAESVEAVAHAYWSHPDDHALRWAMVRCASDLGGDHAEAFLAEVLLTEVGPEASRDVHHFSSVAEESSQRMQAVRGLAGPAAAGSERATAALGAALDHPITVVRHAAFVAVRDLPAEVRASDALARGLERATREFAGVGVADVADHPLPGDGFESERQPMPPSADGLGLDRPSTRRAPRIGGQGGDGRG